MRSTFILYDDADGHRFVARKPSGATAIAMTPDARAVLVRTGLPVLSSHQVLGDEAEAKLMTRVLKAKQALQEAFANFGSELGPAARETLVHDAHWQAAFYLRLWYLLERGGPWSVFTPEGVDSTNDRKEAHKLLLNHLRHSCRGHLHFLGTCGPIGRSGLRLINNLAARLLNGRRVFVTHGMEYGMPNFAMLAESELGAQAVVLRGASGRTRNDWGSALKSLWTAATGNASSLVVPATANLATEKAARAALFSIPDTDINRGLTFFGDLLCREAALADGLAENMRSVLSLIEPTSLVAYSMRWGNAAALAEAAGKLSVPRILISHGSHTRLDGAIGNQVERELASGLLVSSLTDRVVVQSPSAQAVLEAHGAQTPTIRSRPIMWAWRDLPKKKDSGKRTILHAGTFKPMQMPRPWLYETPDEYLEGLTALIYAAEAMTDTELVIRLRPLPECSMEAIETLLPRSANCRFQTGGSFLEDLAQADLLVSYSSTTIEEALHARRPVLLWGGTNRYAHLPARETPPDAGNRAAVYRVQDQNALPAMIKAILGVHHDAPLSDDEIAPYVWPPGTSGIPALLEEILAEETPATPAGTPAKTPKHATIGN